MAEGESRFDADVLVIGSGFGGAVAALRFAEAGEKVLVLERGNWVTREKFLADFDLFWDPERNAFGPHDFRFPGKRIFSWLGSGVGGGSNLFAATLLRRVDFEGFPAGMTLAEMERYYARAEDMMGATPYPDYPPYSEVRGTRLLLEAGAKLAASHPELVEEHGRLTVAVSFAPPGGKPGAPFVNKHGAKQRYSDPTEQAILGGDIDCKNSLDRNYLFLAQQRGAEIKAMHEVTRIEPLADGYRVHYRILAKDHRRLARLRRRLLPRSMPPPHYKEGSYTAKRLVVSAGALGSTELLLRSRDVDKTLPRLSSALGQRYNNNGDYITLLVPFRGLFVSWFGVLAALVACLLGRYAWAVPGLLLYYVGLLVSDRAYDPDIGETNSDYIRFKSYDGKPQGLYIEGGRYPTPGKWGIAAVLSLLGRYRPRRYRLISRWVDWLRQLVPPFGAIGRTWPLPLLTLGRDNAYGVISLDEAGKASIDYDVESNQPYYRHADRMGRLVARAAKGWWIPNVLQKWSGRLQCPHNQGGCPMGDSPETGVVDHAGRVFGYRNLMVLDGAIIPVSPRPNPALTILAIAERAMDIAVAQLRTTGELNAQVTTPAPNVPLQAAK